MIPLQTGIACHEIGHTLGFWHEQSRFDRNDYIKLVTHNIYELEYGNFARASRRVMDDFGVPYDLGSVMHYGPKVSAGVAEKDLSAREPTILGVQRQRRYHDTYVGQELSEDNRPKGKAFFRRYQAGQHRLLRKYEQLSLYLCVFTDQNCFAFQAYALAVAYHANTADIPTRLEAAVDAKFANARLDSAAPTAM